MSENQDDIPIRAQYELASDPGYLPDHIKLTATLRRLSMPAIAITSPHMGHSDRVRHKDASELHEQACEDAARHILLGERTIKSIPADEARAMVAGLYEQYLANPNKAGASRAAAVH